MTSYENFFYLILFPFFLAPNFSYCQDHTVSELGPSKSNPTCARRSRMTWSHIWIHLWLDEENDVMYIYINLAAKRSTRPGFTLTFTYTYILNTTRIYILMLHSIYIVLYEIYICISIHIPFLSFKTTSFFDRRVEEWTSSNEGVTI